MHKLFTLENPTWEKPANDCLYYDCVEFQALTTLEGKTLISQWILIVMIPNLLHWVPGFKKPSNPYYAQATPPSGEK